MLSDAITHVFIYLLTAFLAKNKNNIKYKHSEDKPVGVGVIFLKAVKYMMYNKYSLKLPIKHNLYNMLSKIIICTINYGRIPFEGAKPT